MRRLLAVVVATILALLAGGWLVFANPLNLGVRKSEHFTDAKFEAIRTGEPIGAVVQRLGEPLTITRAVGFPGVCPPATCDIYAFTGQPAEWVIGHREAWVVVNRQGRVVHTLWNVEP